MPEGAPEAASGLAPTGPSASDPSGSPAGGPPGLPAGRVRREIVSFVRRGSRLTAAQERADEAFAERYVLDVERGQRDTLAAPGVRLDPRAIFGNDHPLIVEIGSGQGDSIAAAAAARPEVNFLAFEVYRPGIAQTLLHLERLGLPRNVRLLEIDAQHSLATLLPEGSISEVWIFFADPWHKAKHHKRRLISEDFLRTLLPLLAPGARVRTATDWADYGAHQARAFAALEAEGLVTNEYPDGPRPAGSTTDAVPEDMPERGFSPRFEGRVTTAFENKAHAAGRLVWELTYTRKR